MEQLEHLGEPNEITKINYEVGLVELIELIKMSDFVAIDCTVETTGLLLKNETFNPAYIKDVNDWTGAWYDTVKSKEKSHCLLEVGVAVFKRVPEEPMELEAEVFNIPLLPACLDDNEIARFRGRTSVRLQFDGYGREFIRRVKFDMNKVFYAATPYLNRELQEQADLYMVENPNFMVATRKRRLNAYLMPKLFAEVGEKERKSIIDRLKGVSNVFEAISELKVPVVGHHLLLKLMLIYKDFFEYLPDAYPEFLDKIGEKFKLVYDTKQLAHDLLPNFPDPYLHDGPKDKPAAGDMTLYEMIRHLYGSGERLTHGYTVHVRDRSDVYVEDLLDLFDGIKVEDEIESFCYVAGFDALACGVLFLDLVSIMDNNSKLPGDGELKTKSMTSNVVYQDFLDMVLKGGSEADRFKNKLYMAPQVPDRKSIVFLEQLQIKKELWRQKREEEERVKEENAEKSILKSTKFNNKPSGINIMPR